MRNRASHTVARAPSPHRSVSERGLTPSQVGQPMVHPCENQKQDWPETQGVVPLPQ